MKNNYFDIVPKDSWIKCKTCKKNVYKDQLDKFKTCPYCGSGFPVYARDRLKWFDFETFKEIKCEKKFSDVLQIDNYSKKILESQKKTRLNDSVLVGVGKRNKKLYGIGIMDPFFIMGSMGVVCGELITQLFEASTKLDIPIIIVCCSGGARMQEGILSLMQMQKVVNAVKIHSDSKLPYISVLSDPTYGGVTASFASSSDILIGESHSRIGFSGKNVIENTIHQKLPDNFQTAEFQMNHGLLDIVIDRKDSINLIFNILAYLGY